MSFAIDTYDIPTLETYADALAHWHSVKPWRGEPASAPRPLEKRAKKHMTVWLDPATQDVRFTLHATDVVTYHPNGTISLRPYDSLSTNKFANAVLPRGLYAQFTNVLGPVVMAARLNIDKLPINYVYWAVPRSGVTLFQTKDKDGLTSWLPDRYIPFAVVKVDRKAANAAARESGLDDFRTWADAYVQLGGELRSTDYLHYPVRSADEALRLLADRTQWVHLFRGINAEAGYQWLRNNVIARAGALNIITHDSVNIDKLAQAERSYRQWNRLASLPDTICYSKVTKS